MTRAAAFFQAVIDPIGGLACACDNLARSSGGSLHPRNDLFDLLIGVWHSELPETQHLSPLVPLICYAQHHKV